MRATSGAASGFSSSPPGMSTTLSARWRSAASATASAACGAETLSTSRSTGAGSDSSEGRHGQPSIASAPGLITVTAAGSKPSRRTFRRMIRPGFIFSETPITAIERGSRRFFSRASGRGGGGAAAAGAIRPSASSATSRPPLTTSGFASSSARPRPPASFASASSRRTAPASAASGSRADAPRCGSVASRTAASRESASSIAPSRSSAGENAANVSPSRSAFARNSACTPPGPSVTTGPKSRVSRRPSRNSWPGPVSWGTNSQTRNPSSPRCPSRRSISRAAAATASTREGTTATACISLLWRTAGETAFTTTRSPGTGTRVHSAISPASGTRSRRGTSRPAASSRSSPSGSSTGPGPREERYSSSARAPLSRAGRAGAPALTRSPRAASLPPPRGRLGTRRGSRARPLLPCARNSRARRSRGAPATGAGTAKPRPP